ncbi:cystathionine gamma-synthase [Idiomarina tyrosinivorans]|uniref:Cystathionine gamma-synthase n=2 Tax=Idiomarina tyrosinivorans TaxID=1445662 RepID=A0A432ZSE0_9GAMM|nr:cystathionine gamma-synthase [Idiomarina tyrosinivorans]
MQTRVAQALGEIDQASGSLIAPIHVSTTYLRDADNQYRSGRIYSRADNPSYLPAERVIASLENAIDAKLFASGNAAATTVFQALKPGDRMLAPKVMYWALRNWLKTFGADMGLQVRWVDMDDLAQVRSALAEAPTRLVWIETPGNPLWTVTDIAKVSDLAHQHGALVAVDSTVATPVLSRPLELGADIVMHSATKYLNGHSDVIAGALASRENSEFWQRIVRLRAQSGNVLGPFEASQLLRGMRTLVLRVKQSCEAAQWIAEQLEQLPSVAAVLYPGLPSFAGHEIAKQQMQGGFGGMLSVRISAGEAAAIGTAARTQIWKRATSLGGVESLIEHRASIEGEGTPVPADLLRLSVGIEDPQELFEDLRQAIEAASA